MTTSDDAAVHSHDTDRCLSVESDVMIDGTYLAVVRRGETIVCTLPRPIAMRWADGITRHLTHARYEAAILAQLTERSVPDHLAAGLLGDMRADRAPVDPALTAPWKITGLVSHRTKKAILAFDDGVGPFQLDEASAQEFVQHLLTVSAGVDMDASYRQALVNLCGLDDITARNAVRGVGDYLK